MKYNFTLFSKAGDLVYYKHVIGLQLGYTKFRCLLVEIKLLYKESLAQT